MKHLFLILFLATAALAQAWQQVNETAPEPAREFRAAWVATVYNLDWPSRAGLPAEEQRAELLHIIEMAAKLRLNAILLQVRPNGDALYKSSLEPWSAWLSGPGENPGYDPLEYAIREAHRRGIEVHAWFNPFRATISGRPVVRGHIARRQPGWLLQAGSTQILNPSRPQTREYVMSVIMDVVKRYNIDGVHLDDYFYPYPPHHNVNDGRTPAQRRAAIDSFVQELYR
ncbi:MAG: family 10 glycosylhydrolase [Akkermansia sp.]|nr:family 10 glycosylhydrolase [Akkermansia sp.]